MGGVKCPNCGKDNMDFLDNCQFCQAVLRRESTLNIGENPTKQVTGDLEAILPDWLRDARKQSMDSADEDVKAEAAKPKVQKEEPSDLLAGLAFQAPSSDDDEIPDWLAAINPVAKEIPVSPKPAKDEPIDFFTQFNQPLEEAATSGTVETVPGAGFTFDEPQQQDELLGSFDARETQDDNAWMNNLGAPVSPEPAKPAEPEDLSWLHELESSTKQQPAAPQADTGWMSNLDSLPAQPTSSQDDLGWLNNLGGTPAPSFDTSAQPTSSQDDLGWLNNLGGTPAPSFDTSAQPTSSQDNLGWLNNLGGTPAPSFETPAQPASSQDDMGWLNNLGGTPAPSFDEPAQPASSQDDMGWLNNLGGTPAPSFDEPAQPASSQDDLGWLNNMGGTSTPSFETPAQPVSSQDDLGWLNNMGGTSTPSFETPAQPASSQDDLGWLNNLDGTPTPSLDIPAQPVSSQDDMGWLNNLGGTPASMDTPAQPVSSQDDLGWLSNLDGASTPSLDTPAQPVSSQDDLGWLNNLGNTSAPSFDAQPVSQDSDWLNNLVGGTPTITLDGSTPVSEPNKPSLAQTDQLKSSEASLEDVTRSESMPDWLNQATDVQSSMPPLDAVSMDWSTSKDKADEQLLAPSVPAQTQETPASTEQNLFPASSDSSSLSNQDVDSLFAVDIPDWFSQPEPLTNKTSAQENIPSQANDSLAPVNLPSWVQAMRPVEAAISPSPAISVDQNTEREGPLAGLRGVIPSAPIGSALRPKTISLKLQATEEQQTTAALLEQIIASETTAHPLKTTPFVASQRILRRSLTALFLIVLGAIVTLHSQMTLVIPSNTQLNEIDLMAKQIQSIPQSAPVLVVMNYEPALAGEMEAVAGPLLNQLVAARKPNFTFIATSPTGSALAERLLAHTNISKSAPNGFDYKLNAQYFNVGYLPGGSAGVYGFVESPKTILPAVNVNLFSDFAAVIIVTDHAESGLVWIEQIQLAKQANSALVNQPLLIAASAQAGPLLQPYVSSKQVNGMISGLSDASSYEHMNGGKLGIARSYWDAFGVGLFMAIIAIVLGSLWNLIAGLRTRRASAGQG